MILLYFYGNDAVDVHVIHGKGVAHITVVRFGIKGLDRVFNGNDLDFAVDFVEVCFLRQRKLHHADICRATGDDDVFNFVFMLSKPTGIFGLQKTVCTILFDEKRIGCKPAQFADDLLFTVVDTVCGIC